MEIVKDIAAIVGLFISITTLISLCTKGGRAAIKRMFNKHTSDIREENKLQTSDITEIKSTLKDLQDVIAALEEVSCQRCRDTIKNIYYRYCKEERIPLYERKTADYTYKIYHEKFNGNSYAALLYKEICKWSIDSTNLLEEDYK